MHLSSVSQREVLGGGGGNKAASQVLILLFCSGCQWHLVILLPSAGRACSYEPGMLRGDYFSSADLVNPVALSFLFFFRNEREKTNSQPFFFKTNMT